MDRMYRWTRHVYDLTRRYYLLGRDRLIDHIAARPAGRVLEVGCGTARNLRRLHERAPQHTLYGLDVSRAMLATARRALTRAGCAQEVTLQHGRAEEWSPADEFGITGSFDVIFFSYVLSMIPSWPAALGTALSHLAPRGRLYIVDFWDQAHLPNWAGVCLRRWLSLFDVFPRPALIRMLRTLEAQKQLRCSIRPVARRYAYFATVAPPLPEAAPVERPVDRIPAETAGDGARSPRSTPPLPKSLAHAAPVPYHLDFGPALGHARR